MLFITEILIQVGTEEGTILLNDLLHNFYSSPSVTPVRGIQSRRIGRVGHVSYIERQIFTKWWLENIMGRGNLENHDIDGG